MNLFTIFVEYIKIGLFNVGGGLATLPFLFRLAENRTWFTKTEIPDMLAVAQMVPGAIGINLMTYSGMYAGAPAGAIIAAIAFVLPSIFIIIAIEKMYEQLKKNTIVQNVFCGMRPAAAGLLAAVICGLLNTTLIKQAEFPLTEFSLPELYKRINYRECIIIFIFFVLMTKPNKRKSHPSGLFIAAGAILGIVLKL